MPATCPAEYSGAAWSSNRQCWHEVSRRSRVVEIDSGNAVYRIRGDRVVDINSGNAVFRIRE